ncbi:M28 family peptidase [Bacillus sp. es.034]|uniref:M28 family peptidase n=1 Tax=Bacillus sp. es.034 TaxID=1761763 RepID=UPI000BF52953|nr:M28 family peptidase [Bacillus sp. es.034]PFG04515.1 PA domain-containing protein [Bacillus sp. es.034]
MGEIVSDQSLLDKVSQEKLMEYTRTISSEVRLSGSEEEWRAFLYAKGVLDELGLRTKLKTSKAFVSWPISADMKVDGVSYPCITHSMAVSTGGEGLSGEIVYIGAGTDEEYESAEVKGKVLLIDGLAIPGAVAKAQEEGAKGLVFINAEYTHEMIVSTVWGNPTPQKQNQYPNLPVISINYADGEKVKQKLKGKESLPIWFKTEVETGWKDIPTLEAELKGTDPTGSFVLFSGHIDSWHYGAMDNGTANAVMLEVARVLSEEKVELNRSLRFAFWSGHSHGRYAGSALYCDENWEELYESCVLHVNIDSVGAKESVVLTEGNCMAETKDIAGQVIKDQVSEEYEGSRFGRAGDQSFWGPGVPSLLMGLSEQVPATTAAAQAFTRLFGAGKGGGFGWWWHTTEDTMDKIDPEFLERDCRIYLSIIDKACTSDVLPIDQRKAVEELKSHLVHYQEAAPELKKLSIALSRISQLHNKIKSVYERIESENLSDEQLAEANRWIHSLSKGLVHLNYVGGNVFDHDQAMGQPPIPLLADILKWKEITENEPEHFVFLTGINRNLNQVNFILKELLEKAGQTSLLKEG